MSFWMLVCCMMAGGDLEVVRSFTVPEAQASAGIPEPVAVTRGPDGRTYLLEGNGQRVLVWDQDGNLVKTIGTPGRGAGQFQLKTTAKSRAVGFLAAREDGIYVYDGGQRRMHVFDPSTYQLTDHYTFRVKPGQPKHLAVVEETQLLVNWVSLENGRNFTVALFNPDKYTSVTLASRPDTSASHAPDENGIMLLTYKAFAPELAARYDARTGHILWGDGSKPVLHQLSKADNGNWNEVAALTVDMKQEDVVNQDKRNIMQLPFLLQGGNSTVDFPDMRPYFNDILTYGESDYLLIYRYLPGERVYGTRIGADGTVKGSLDMEVTEDELLDASRGVLYHVETLGGIHVHQLRFK